MQRQETYFPLHRPPPGLLVLYATALCSDGEQGRNSTTITLRELEIVICADKMKELELSQNNRKSSTR